MERVADYIVRKLKEAGTEHIFLITGRGVLYLTDAVARECGIKPVSTFHEQGASYGAMAYAAATGGISACLVSTGCAAANAITAALCAYQDNLPVVFVSGNHILNETTRYTGVPIRTYGSQETDIVKLVESITKYAVMLTNKNRAVFEVEKALYLACEGRKGPVWLDVPVDVQNMRIDEGACEHFMRSTSIKGDVQKEIRETAKWFESASRPLLLIGGGARRAENEIRELADKYSLPVVFSPAASDIYGSSHKLSIGALGSLGGSRAGNFAVQNADFILAVGTRLCSQETGMKDKFAREAKIIVVDVDSAEHTKAGVSINKVINDDAKTFLSELLQQKLSKVSDEWTQQCRHWKQLFSIKNEPFIQDLIRNNELDVYSLMDMMSDRLPDDATVITDAGFEELIIPSTIRFRDGQRCLFPASQGAMGYAIPAVLGAHYAGRKNIICIVGDGSFMMNMQELQIIRHHNVPVKFIVISNQMYAVIRKRQKDLFRTRTIGNDPSDGVPGPDFKKIADCFGFQYKKVISRDEMEIFMNELFSNDVSARLVEVVCTPDQKYLHESYGLSEKKKLVHRPIEDMAPFLDREIIRREMIVDMLEE